MKITSDLPLPSRRRGSYGKIVDILRKMRPGDSVGGDASFDRDAFPQSTWRMSSYRLGITITIRTDPANKNRFRVWRTE